VCAEDVDENEVRDDSSAVLFELQINFIYIRQKSQTPSLDGSQLLVQVSASRTTGSGLDFLISDPYPVEIQGRWKMCYEPKYHFV